MNADEPSVVYAGVRSAVGENDAQEWHVECRMSDGQKLAAIVVDGDFPELACRIARMLNNNRQPLVTAGWVCQDVSIEEDENLKIEALVAQLREGYVLRQKRWSGDTHAEKEVGSCDIDATDKLMGQAADAIEEMVLAKNEIDRLRILIETARVESSLATAGLAGFALQKAPDDPGVEAVLRRLASIERMLACN
jgi:hypothetical protein